MAKVSIIIPVYNVEAYLVECMESVRNQTLKEIEIICVNDGSTDDSLKILYDYQRQDSRIHIINQENSGYGKAMNRGIAHATGDYIGIVEPDDYVALNMYEELYAKAVQYNLDFIKADFYRFTREKNGNMKMLYHHLSSKQEYYQKIFNPSKNPETLRFIMNTWSGIYKRSFLEKYQIRHNETPGASFQDNGFWFQTFIYGKRAMILDTPYYRNRRDNPNSSINSKEKVYCINAEYDFIRELLFRDPKLWERFHGMYWFKKYHNYMGTLKRIGDSYKWEYFMRFYEELKRGSARGELDETVFSELAWAHIQNILKNPDEYYLRHIHPMTMNQKVADRMHNLENQNRKLQKEITKIRRSKSFRLGRCLLSGPIRLKKMIKGGKKRG